MHVYFYLLSFHQEFKEYRWQCEFSYRQQYPLNDDLRNRHWE